MSIRMSDQRKSNRPLLAHFGLPFFQCCLIAFVVSFSSVFYLASAKICSHTYHQLLAETARRNRRSKPWRTSDNNHSYILRCVFMHFGSVGSFHPTQHHQLLFFPLCAVLRPKPDCLLFRARGGTLSHLKRNARIFCATLHLLMDYFHGNSAQNKNKHGLTEH